jgi:hypothetical protein
VRGIPTSDNLIAHVEGIIEDIDGVIKITAIKLRYQLKIPPGTREKAKRALDLYADSCPAYTSVKGCIKCTWEAIMEETLTLRV